MKLIRTARSYDRLAFGPDDDTDLNEADPEAVVHVDYAGVVVSDSDAKRYAERAEELGVGVVVEDAEEGAKSGDTPPAAAVVAGVVTGRPVPTPPGAGAPLEQKD